MKCFILKKFFVERIHNLLTDFIYKMPEKIKEIRIKNEESFKYADESFNQTNTGNIHMMGGDMNITGGGAATYYQNNLSYTNHQSFYHHKPF